jgi:hypothetical protein
MRLGLRVNRFRVCHHKLPSLMGTKGYRRQPGLRRRRGARRAILVDPSLIA